MCDNAKSMENIQITDNILHEIFLRTDLLTLADCALVNLNIFTYVFRYLINGIAL